MLEFKMRLEEKLNVELKVEVFESFATLREIRLQNCHCITALVMSGIRTLIATGRQHRYASTRLGRKSLVLHLFKRMVDRHVADLEAHDKLAFSDNFKGTLV